MQKKVSSFLQKALHHRHYTFFLSHTLRVQGRNLFFEQFLQAMMKTTSQQIVSHIYVFSIVIWSKFWYIFTGVRNSLKIAKNIDVTCEGTKRYFFLYQDLILEQVCFKHFWSMSIWSAAADRHQIFFFFYINKAFPWWSYKLFASPVRAYLL